MVMPKKVLVALPTKMLEEIDFTAQLEHRTRSDLIREALRRYLIQSKQAIPNIIQMPIQPTPTATT